MADLAFVAVVVGFFLFCALYVRACDRMITAADDDGAGESGE